jgi:hypothetical protein
MSLKSKKELLLPFHTDKVSLKSVADLFMINFSRNILNPGRETIIRNEHAARFENAEGD